MRVSIKFQDHLKILWSMTKLFLQSCIRPYLARSKIFRANREWTDRRFAPQNIKLNILIYSSFLGTNAKQLHTTPKLATTETPKLI